MWLCATGGTKGGSSDSICIYLHADEAPPRGGRQDRHVRGASQMTQQLVDLVAHRARAEHRAARLLAVGPIGRVPAETRDELRRTLHEHLLELDVADATSRAVVEQLPQRALLACVHAQEEGLEGAKAVRCRGAAERKVRLA